MNKTQIKELKIELKKAKKLENKLSNQLGKLAHLINLFTGINGYVDYLPGDGFGFTPESDNDTHVGVDEITKWAENGEEITEQLILSRKSF